MAWRSRTLWKSRSYWGFRSEELTKSHRAKKWSHMKTEKGFWYFVLTTSLRDAPWGTSGKKSAGQCRRHQKCEFDPWVGKIPWSGNGPPCLSTQYSHLESFMDKKPGRLSTHMWALTWNKFNFIQRVSEKFAFKIHVKWGSRDKSAYFLRFGF